MRNALGKPLTELIQGRRYTAENMPPNNRILKIVIEESMGHTEYVTGHS